MLIGFLLPLLRRFSARGRVLISAAVMVAGLALATAMVMQGHAHRDNVLLVRWGLLLAIIGLGLLVSSVRAFRREQASGRRHGAGT